MEKNTTLSKPVGFLIAGFQSLQHVDYYFIFLVFVYLGTLIANFLLMSVIWLSHSLHTPKYLAVFNLSFADVCISTALIPKCIDHFLLGSKFVLYDSCLTQMFFFHYFYCVESLSLVVMAYERFVSICFPLRSSSINTNTRMMYIIFVSWVFILAYLIVLMVFLTKLSFCTLDPIIQSYFCDHGPLYRIACSDNTPNRTIGITYTVVFIFVPLVVIALSYMCIIAALLKIVSAEGRWKAFKTCTAHIILVVIFYIPVFVTYILAWIKTTIDTDLRILNTSLAACLPPLLNPIIYTLKTEEVMEQIKQLLRKQNVKPLK
ncbi:OR6S1 protein, partial [Amia calva]|nr:OR6S1 protein [Amia calva]